MQNLIIAINCVLPVFIVICTGALIRYSGKVPPEVFPKLSTMAFHFLLPCMLFNSIYQTDLSISFDPALIGNLMAFTLLWFGVGFIVCTIFVPDHRARGAFIQSFYRSNIAIVGISMADSMTGSEGVAAISMVIAIIIPIMIWAPFWTSIFNANPDVVKNSAILLRCISPFYVCCCVNQVISAALRGSGNTTAPMIIMLLVSMIIPPSERRTYTAAHRRRSPHTGWHPPLPCRPQC